MFRLRTACKLLAFKLFIVIKIFFDKFQPKIVKHRDYKYFENDAYRTYLLSELAMENIKEKEKRLNNLPNACKRLLCIHDARKGK